LPLEGSVLPVENPARRQIISEIPRGGAADVDRAVGAAAAAFPGWAGTTAKEFDIDEVKSRLANPAIAPTVVGADIETGRATP
jgi:acyl-CoA reductase-like NAD-dependent aldehyde dehydrogenase